MYIKYKELIMKNILLLLFILKGIVMAIEEPNYKIIEKNDAFEIREYESYIIAQMQVTGCIMSTSTTQHKDGLQDN